MEGLSERPLCKCGTLMISKLDTNACVSASVFVRVSHGFQAMAKELQDLRHKFEESV